MRVHLFLTISSLFMFPDSYAWQESEQDRLKIPHVKVSTKPKKNEDAIRLAQDLTQRTQDALQGWTLKTLFHNHTQVEPYAALAGVDTLERLQSAIEVGTVKVSTYLKLTPDGIAILDRQKGKREDAYMLLGNRGIWINRGSRYLFETTSRRFQTGIPKTLYGGGIEHYFVDAYQAAVVVSGEDGEEIASFGVDVTYLSQHVLAQTELEASKK